jgi:hypothetical protein
MVMLEAIEDNDSCAITFLDFSVSTYDIIFLLMGYNTHTHTHTHTHTERERERESSLYNDT